MIALIRLLHTRLALDLDFETIQRVSRTATLADLSQVENDALYLIHFLPHVLLPGPCTPLLVLVEHKASVDYYTPLQEGHYITTHWWGRRQRSLPPGVAPQERLPAAVVIRLYTGQAPWSTPRTLPGLVVAPDYLQPPAVPWLELELDLVRFPTQDLRALASPLGWALVLTQAEGADPAAYAVTRREVMAGLKQTAQTDPDDTWMVVWYVVLHLFHRRTAAEYDEEAPVVFDWAQTLFAHAQTEVDQMAQSMADVIRERGERIGEQRGIVQMQDLVLAGVEERFRGALQSVEARVRALRTAEVLQQAQRALVGAANEEEFLTRLAGGPGGTSGT